MRGALQCAVGAAIAYFRNAAARAEPVGISQHAENAGVQNEDSSAGRPYLMRATLDLHLVVPIGEEAVGTALCSAARF
jgi:hypothetical protein